MRALSTECVLNRIDLPPRWEKGLPRPSPWSLCSSGVYDATASSRAKGLATPPCSCSHCLAASGIIIAEDLQAVAVRWLRRPTWEDSASGRSDRIPGLAAPTLAGCFSESNGFA